MSFTDDLNRIFTPEGRAEAVERAFDIPSGWDAQSPVAPAAEQQVPTAAPNADTQAPEDQQPVFPVDPRFEQVRTMVQGVVQENQRLTAAEQQRQQADWQRDEHTFAAEIAALQETNPAQAVALVQQRANGIIQNVISTAQAEIQRRDAALASALVGGFTQEIIADHPSLSDTERQLLETIPDPDHRAQWADYFEGQHEAQRQAALQQGATLHAASGAGAGLGAVPAGTAPERTGRESSYDIIRRTPWQTIPG